MDKAIKKYLQLYAHNLSSTLETETLNFCNLAIVVPAYKETLESFQHFLALAQSTPQCLLIWINNHPSDQTRPASHDEIRNYLLDKPGTRKVNQHAYLHNSSNAKHGAVLLMDLELEPQYGVGEARKIGNDICCSLFFNAKLQTPWVFNCDADCLPESSHLDALRVTLASETMYTGTDDIAKAAALLFPFQHLPHKDPKLHKASQQYQQHLEYYRQGLEWAGSDFAFHTIGSTIVLNLEPYAKVRGFPMKNAAEDFYLLNKLAKLGSIVQINSSPMAIQTRTSDRVPFGTGPALEKIVNLQQHEKFESYHPACFAELKRVLETLKQKPDTLLQDLQVNHNDSFAVLLDLGLERFMEHSHKQCKNHQQYLLHLSSWFDAFRTRKYIHRLTELHFPKLSLSEINCYLQKQKIPIRQFSETLL